MVEEKKEPLMIRTDIAIKKCEQGFMVLSSHYGLDEIRAFSTPEGLIEWLSRELGCGPIVWGWTLPIWMEMVGVKEDDLLPLPDIGVDPAGYREAQEHNAAFLITRFADKVEEARHPEPPPEPKVKKEKKVKGEKPKAVFHVPGDEGTITMIPEEEKPPE